MDSEEFLAAHLGWRAAIVVFALLSASCRAPQPAAPSFNVPDPIAPLGLTPPPDLLSVPSINSLDPLDLPITEDPGVAVQTPSGVILIDASRGVLGRLDSLSIDPWSYKGIGGVLLEVGSKFATFGAGYVAIRPYEGRRLALNASGALVQKDDGAVEVQKSQLSWPLPASADNLKLSRRRHIASILLPNETVTYSLPDETTKHLQKGCWMADFRLDRALRLCGDELTLVRSTGESVVLKGPPFDQDNGAWTGAAVSPDDRWVLADWTNECGTMTYAIDIGSDDRSPVAVGGDSANLVQILTWTSSGGILGIVHRCVSSRGRGVVAFGSSSARGLYEIDEGSPDFAVWDYYQ